MVLNSFCIAPALRDVFAVLWVHLPSSQVNDCNFPSGEEFPHGHKLHIACWSERFRSPQTEALSSLAWKFQVYMILPVSSLSKLIVQDSGTVEAYWTAVDIRLWKKDSNMLNGTGTYRELQARSNSAASLSCPTVFEKRSSIQGELILCSDFCQFFTLVMFDLLFWVRFEWFESECLHATT